MYNWTEKEAIREARKFYGIPKLERNCRLTMFGNRMMKAYRVPGTREHGEYTMLLESMKSLVNQLMASKQGITK